MQRNGPAQANPVATDVWKTVVERPDDVDAVPWKDMTQSARIKHVGVLVAKVIGLILLLYIFVCSLDIMSSAFRLVGGKITGKAFSEGAVLSNPIAGLMLGLLATVVVQSSSTSTSIVVSMVSSSTIGVGVRHLYLLSVLPVRRAIPIIMGANIGTSVTNTIVALTQSNRRDEFRRAFAGATVHDMFNWMTVIVLLPLEIVSGLLYHLTDAITKTISLDRQAGSNPQFLNVLTKPLTHRIIQLDEKVIQNIALGAVAVDQSLLKHYCSYENFIDSNGTVLLIPGERCGFIFAHVSWPDWGVGLLLLILSLLSLCTCLVVLVKLLQSMLKGAISTIIFKTVNADFPGVFHHLTPYLAMAVGCIFTILVQSSSIFTSTLTPLVGLGIVTIERMYPFTLGSNIGTTITGIMAALTATTAIELKNSLQIALCHTFFNIFGIILWFPIPILRNVPINLAKKLGEITANYRWFAIVYIVASFFLIPLVIFGVSLAGWSVFAGVFGPIVFVLIFVLLVNMLQSLCPKLLPEVLRSWTWLPRPLRSLGWYDEHICGANKRLICCNGKQSQPTPMTLKQNAKHQFGQTNTNFRYDDDDVDRLSAVSTQF